MSKESNISLALALVVIFSPLSLYATQFYGDEATAPVATYEQPNEGTPVTFDQLPAVNLVQVLQRTFPFHDLYG